MPKTRKFSQEEEEKIINFVKSNEILYKVKHKMFRNSEAKNHLWLQLATELNVDVDVVKKRWATMRDYFIHSRRQISKGSAASASTPKRADALSFLLETSTVKKSTTSSLASRKEPKESSNIKNEAGMADDPLGGILQFTSSESLFQEVFSPNSVSDTPSATTHKTDQHQAETDDTEHEFISQRQKPSNSMPQKYDDGVQLFFDSMASTVRALSQSAIARIKMKVAQIVGEEELAWAEENASRNFMFRQ